MNFIHQRATTGKARLGQNQEPETTPAPATWEAGAKALGPSPTTFSGVLAVQADLNQCSGTGGEHHKHSLTFCPTAYVPVVEDQLRDPSIHV